MEALSEIKSKSESSKNKVSLINQLKDLYSDYQLSDQFKNDSSLNSEYYDAMRTMLKFIVATNTLTFKNMNNTTNK